MSATPLTGKPLVRSAYRLLLQDTSMVVLLFVGGLLSAVAFALVAWPASTILGVPVFGSRHDGSIVSLLVYGAALLASTFVSVLVMGAVVAAAMMRADGLDPTVRSALAVAWSRRGPLLAWAAVATVVGMLIRSLERYGIGGALVRLLAGVAWSLATWFAIPVIIAEGTMPMQTVSRSVEILRTRFGTNVRATIRLGLVWTLALLGTLVVAGYGAWLLFTSGPRAYAAHNLGVMLLVLGGVAFFVVSAVWSAVSAYLRTVLYRYAVGLPTPGIDPRELPSLLPVGGPPAPGYGAAPYGTPGFGAPTYGAPGYGAPGYGAPAYGGPTYGGPGYGGPTDGGPGYAAPQYPAQSYPPPSYPAPSYAAPQYPAPSYPAPSYPAGQYPAPSDPASASAAPQPTPAYPSVPAPSAGPVTPPPAPPYGVQATSAWSVPDAAYPGPDRAAGYPAATYPPATAYPQAEPPSPTP